MTTEGDPTFSLMLRLLALPDLLQAEVLLRLGPRHLAPLARVGRGCAAAVAATALMRWAEDQKDIPRHQCRPGFARVCPRLCWKDACTLAALRGKLAILKLLRADGFPWDSETCRAAAEGGHLQVLEWLHNTGCTWEAWTYRAAAYSGHLEMLIWLHNTGSCPGWDEDLFNVAAHGGQLDVVRWLHETGCPWDDRYTCMIAVQSGKLEMLKWLHNAGCAWDADVFQTAARHGHLHVVEFLHSAGCPSSTFTCCAAASGGQLEVLKWLWAHDYPWHEEDDVMDALLSRRRKGRAPGAVEVAAGAQLPVEQEQRSCMRRERRARGDTEVTA